MLERPWFVHTRTFISSPYFLFLTDFRCYCLACDAEIDCRFVEPVFEPVCWLVVPLIFAECGLIDRVGMKFIIVICRTKYLFWNPQIGSVRNSKSVQRKDQGAHEIKAGASLFSRLPHELMRCIFAMHWVRRYRPSLNGERVEGEEGEVLLEGVAVVGDV